MFLRSWLARCTRLLDRADAASDTARHRGAVTYELRAAVRYGRWLVDRGDRDDAVRLVGAASDRCEAALGPTEASGRELPSELVAARGLLQAWVARRSIS